MRNKWQGMSRNTPPSTSSWIIRENQGIGLRGTWWGYYSVLVMKAGSGRWKKPALKRQNSQKCCKSRNPARRTGFAEGYTGIRDNRWTPGSVNMRRKNCFILPAAGRRTQIFHLKITEPGVFLLGHPCTPWVHELACTAITCEIAWRGNRDFQYFWDIKFK